MGWGEVGEVVEVVGVAEVCSKSSVVEEDNSAVLCVGGRLMSNTSIFLSFRDGTFPNGEDVFVLSFLVFLGRS
jgi:hypothetical protein